LTTPGGPGVKRFAGILIRCDGGGALLSPVITNIAIAVFFQLQSRCHGGEKSALTQGGDTLGSCLTGKSVGWKAKGKQMEVSEKGKTVLGKYFQHGKKLDKTG
jgi:hypothetical protein